MRTIIDSVLADRKLPAGHLRVLLAVLYHTSSWSRCVDTVKLQRIADTAGVSVRTVRRALQHLELHGLVYESGDGRANYTRVGTGKGDTMHVPLCDARKGDTQDVPL